MENLPDHTVLVPCNSSFINAIDLTVRSSSNATNIESHSISSPTKPEKQPCTTDASRYIDSSNTSCVEKQKKCSYHRCARLLIEKARSLAELASQTNADLQQEAKLSKPERDHLLRYHSNTPVRLGSLAPGLTVEYARNPDVDMKFQCCCGTTFISRASVARHFGQCDLARSMAVYPHIKCRGFTVLESSMVRPDLNYDDVLESEEEVEESRQEARAKSGDSYLPRIPFPKTKQISRSVSDMEQLSSSLIKAHAQHRDESRSMFNDFTYVIGSRMKHYEEVNHGRVTAAERRIKQGEELRELQFLSQENRIAMLERRLGQLEHALWSQGIAHKAIGSLSLEPKSCNCTHPPSSLQQRTNNHSSRPPSANHVAAVPGYSVASLNNEQSSLQTQKLFGSTLLNSVAGD
ncbi:hypothetical protein BGX21_001599, partial [Mortierella sp. AD011]